MYVTLFYKNRVEKDVHVDKRIAIRFRWCSFITYCIGIFVNTNVSRTPAPCPPHGHREGQTTLTLHRIARSTAPQFAAWSKIEIKDRGVYRFTLVLAPWSNSPLFQLGSFSTRVRSCRMHLHSNLYVATFRIILSRRRGYHFTTFFILDREMRHLK